MLESGVGLEAATIRQNGTVTLVPLTVTGWALYVAEVTVDDGRHGWKKRPMDIMGPSVHFQLTDEFA